MKLAATKPTTKVPNRRRKAVEGRPHQPQDCYFIDERGLIVDFMDNLNKSVSELKDATDPIIELKNGTTHNKKMSQAVKDSWEKLHSLDSKLQQLDERTLVLKDIGLIIDAIKQIHARMKKYLYPILKVAAALTGLIIVIRYVITGEVSLFDVLVNAIKHLFGIQV